MKKFYRSRKNRFVGGVIAGFVDYMVWDIDPNIIRLAYALLTIFSSGGLLLVYLLAWMIVPSEPEVLT
jgi:phage shock protein C